MPDTQGLNRQQWDEKLSALGAGFRAMNVEARLEIIGAWPVIEAVMPGRTRLNLDVWAPGLQVRAIASKCGIAATAADRPGRRARFDDDDFELPEHLPEDAGT